MFGLGFGEMVLLGIVLLVVFGPQELPRMLRTLGRGVRKLQRMSVELRQQSGIDEILREEGLEEDLRDLRSLTRAGMVESLMRPPPPEQRAAQIARGASAPALEALKPPEGPAPDRAREYPEAGCDAYGATETDGQAAVAPTPAGDGAETQPVAATVAATVAAPAEAPPDPAAEERP